jgi:hypothetical protein
MRMTLSFGRGHEQAITAGNEGIIDQVAHGAKIKAGLGRESLG